MKGLILSNINLNEDRYKLDYDNYTYEVRLNIHFSNKFKLTMVLPSSFKLKQLRELLGCYTKLHFKHRPSENHVYGGLKVKSPFEEYMC